MHRRQPLLLLLLLALVCACGLVPAAPPVHATATPSVRPMDSNFTPCKTCIYVMEQIKVIAEAHAGQVQLAAICSQIYLKFPESYSDCHQVLNSLAVNSPNVREWVFRGCHKQEIYGATSQITPCPSHVICASLRNLQDQAYCPTLPPQDPFAAESSGIR